MSCQICVEVCPFDAIKMDTEFELGTDDRFGGLLLDRKQLAKSNEYYHKIHPTRSRRSGCAAGRGKSQGRGQSEGRSAQAAAHRPRSSSPAPPAGGRKLAHGSDARPDLRRSSSTGWLDFCPPRWQPRCRSAAVRRCHHRGFCPLFRPGRSDGAQGTGADAEPLRPQPRRPLRHLATGGRRHQGADQGRHCSADADAVVHFWRRWCWWSRSSWATRCCPWAATWCLVDMDCGPALFLRHGRGDRAVRLHGRLVEPQQVFAARRDARHRADDQLRSAAAAIRASSWS